MPPFKDPEDKRKYQRRYHKEYYKKHKTDIKASVKARKLEIKEWFRELKQTFNCARCGISGEEAPWIIEFHHVNADEKADIVSYLVSNAYGRDRILEEINKCEALCSNCHRIHHFREKEKSGMRKSYPTRKSKKMRERDRKKKKRYRETREKGRR